MSNGRDRVLCVELSEAEWQAFIARHPEPVEWLRTQILMQLDGVVEPPPARRRVSGDAPERTWSSRRV